MILVFGGTTEGRMAVEVCEKAGKPYWYSTKGESSGIPLLNGKHLQGAMDADGIRAFCQSHGVRCIVNAAHPFAEGLHSSLSLVEDIPIIRVQRADDPLPSLAIVCAAFDDLFENLRRRRPKLLLSLCGTSSMAKLEDYWRQHPTMVRVLRRKASLEEAERLGFPKDRLLFYNDSLRRPTVEEEMAMMMQTGCDAVLTKESGRNGGFAEKAEAARRLGIDLYVIKRPKLPKGWQYVDGKHSLRRAIESIVPDFFPLRTGLTTGACATAATKAALLSLLGMGNPSGVSISLPDGESVSVPVDEAGEGYAVVTKDRSDDPDVTRGCRVWSRVRLRDDGQVCFLRGEGVGLVTLPGLGIPVGGPAINRVPRKMIESEVLALSSRGADVTIGVEGGEELAKHTFNPRLGIEGGISIVGTSGIVSPLSNEAFILSLRRELEVAQAMGCTEIAFVSGKRSEDAVKASLGLRCVHCVNLIGEALKTAYSMGCFRRVVVGLMIGKALKLASGKLDTHSKTSVIDADFVRSVAEECGTEASPRGGWGSFFFARELWECMPPAFFDRIKELCLHHCRRVYPAGSLEIVLVCEQGNS